MVLQGWGTRAGADFGVEEGVGSAAPGGSGFKSAEGLSAVFKASVLPESAATAVTLLSSQNPLVEGLGTCGKFLGFGATVGGAALAGCPWRRGRGRGSGLFATPKSLLLPSPLLPSATCCCSKACILALRVAMSSSSSSPSSLSDWLCPLLSLRRSGKPQSSALKASSSS